MARLQKPPRGRLIVSIIYSYMDGLADALKMLERQFGRVQFETTEIPYTSEQYSEEMGHNLQRRFFSFEKLVERDDLVRVKSICCKLEKQFGDHIDDYTFRTVNLDPGILTPDNLVMASCREYNHRIYLFNGIFAEMALVYAKNCFMRLPWTLPDYYHDEAIEFFERVRDTFQEISQPIENQVG